MAVLLIVGYTEGVKGVPVSSSGMAAAPHGTPAGGDQDDDDEPRDDL